MTRVRGKLRLLTDDGSILQSDTEEADSFFNWCEEWLKMNSLSEDIEDTAADIADATVEKTTVH